MPWNFMSHLNEIYETIETFMNLLINYYMMGKYKTKLTNNSKNKSDLHATNKLFH